MTADIAKCPRVTKLPPVESEVPQQKTALTFKGHFGVVAKSMD